jgi:hypothetical protein
LTQLLAAATPLADIAAVVLTLLAAGLALVHSGSWPSAAAWSKGHFLLYAQFVVFGLLGLIQVAILIARRRSGRNKKLEESCQIVAAYVDDHCPRIPLKNVGVHIWTAAGPPFARYLRRSGGFLLAGERERSGIVWVKGKGVVGTAWAEGRPIIRDIDAIRMKAVSRSAYEELTPEETMGLTWDEFRKTPHYCVVSGIPLYGRTGDGSQVRAVVAIDLLESNHFTELDAAMKMPAFAYVIGFCEGSL